MLIPLLAQAAAAVASPEAAAQQGVISYPASYFADQQVANASEMLSRLPGFSIDNGSSVRGFEGAAGNVLIDGQRPTSKSENLEDILRRIQASQVERIDVIRGGAPGIDMQGKSVLANVIRKPGGGLRGTFAAVNNHLWDGRNMYGLRLELSGAKDDRRWETTARVGRGTDDGGNRGPQVRLAPDGSIVRRSFVNNESDGIQKTLTGAYSQPLFGGRVSLNGRLFWDSWKYEETNTYSQPANFGAAVENDPHRAFETEAGARFNRDLGERTQIEALVLRTDRSSDSDSYFTFRGDLSEFHNDRDYSETIGRAVVKRQQSSKLSFEVGGESAYNALDSRTRVADNGVDIPIPAANVKVDELRGEVFVKATWQAWTGWTFDGALRYEASRISSEGDVSLEKTLYFLKPRLSVSWAPRPSTQVRLRFEREVDQLDFDDFVASSDFNLGTGVTAGNPDLDPMQAWVSEATLEQRFRGATLVLTYRHAERTDVVDRGPVRLIITDPDTGQPVETVFDQPTNIGDGTRDDLEASLNVPSDPFGWKGGLLKASLEKHWSEVIDPTTLTPREVSRLRPLNWRVEYTQDLPEHHLSFGGGLYGGWLQPSYRFNYISEVKLNNAYLVTWVEREMEPGLFIRAEIGNWTSRGIRFITRVYDGPRDTGSLAYIDDRRLKPGPSFYVRVRKTFGS